MVNNNTSIMKENNEALNRGIMLRDQLFVQRQCDKHEFILVTQTTTRNGLQPINESISWMQCKHCGMTISNSQQINNNT